MALISLQDVTLSFGGEPLLDQVSLNIERGQCACLVGRNGSGKTSLLRLLAGEIEPDGGRILRQNGLRVTYLQQEAGVGLEGSVGELVEARAPPRPGVDEVAHAAAARAIITRLELDGAARFETLSGGMRRRVMLARALIGEPDLLMLDEPTNHLDIAAVEWLEDFLRSRVETLLFVTHDRVFLRRVARRIIDLDRGKLVGWECDYDTFLRRKQQLMDDEAVANERLGRLLAQEEAWLRKGVRARRTRNEGRVKALGKLRETFSQRRMEQGTGRITLQSAERSGVLATKVENLSFAYPGGKTLIEGLDLRILRGERIGIIGPNGSGKTTLLRLLTRDLAPTAGSVTFGTQLQVAYFDQLRATLDPVMTVAASVAGERDTVTVNGQERHIYAYLQDFLFAPERARTPVGALSGGERNRLLLARHFLIPSNLLAMDEPTNDLDIETLELLEEQLAQYKGTLLIVSHDRAFINNVVTSTLVLEGGGRVAQYAGGYDDWLAQRPAEEAPRVPEMEADQAADTAAKRGASRRCLGFNEKRELAALPGRIARLEEEQVELREKLGDPGAYRHPPALLTGWRERLEELHGEIDNLFDRWAALEEMK